MKICKRCGHSGRRCNCHLEPPLIPKGGSKERQKGRQEVITFLESDGVIVHTGSLYFYRYLVDRNRFDDRWFTLKGRRTLLEELGVKDESGDEDEDGGSGYEKRHVSRIDDLSTDLWGGAGPDCRTQPVKAGT